MAMSLEILNLSAQNIWDYENGFYWFSDKKRLSKLIAHYEIYKQCCQLPGCIAEFGVFKGNSLYQLATFRDMLEMQEARKIYAFDMFGEFPTDHVQSQNDLAFIEKFTKETNRALNLDEIQSICQFKSFTNIQFIQGNVLNTLNTFLTTNSQCRFNLVHLDLDVYEPTKYVIEHIYPYIVPNGIIMIDDYNAVEGATRAIDEFLLSHPCLKIEKLPFCHVPCFIRKIQAQ